MFPVLNRTTKPSAHKHAARLRGAGLIGVGVLSIVLAACGTTASTSPNTTTRTAATSVPRGWKTYVYEQASISAPANWRVVTDYVCPEPRGPGTLFLGPSKQPGEVCPQYSLDVNSVTLTGVPEAISGPGVVTCPPSRLNGLLVYVEPCASNDVVAGGLSRLVIPGLGVQARATQTGGSVVGSGSSSVVGRVLHTLHRTTAKEVIDSSPVDWPTYTYRAAAISVPSSWAVRRDENCPDTSAEGTLELGIPKVLSNCTLIVGSPAGVTVSALSQGTTFALCSSFWVNGLRAYVADCETRRPFGVTSWAIPSLGVEVSGSGSGSAQSTALVNLILHTVRRATPQDVTNSTPLTLRITLEHTRVAAGRPIKGTAIFTNRSGASILVAACAADGWLIVGIANHDIPYNPGNPQIACAPSVQLASGVTRMPITVMTIYQGCSESGPGSTQFPPCDPGNQLPTLPAGTYHTVVVTSGLPAGMPAPNVVAVTVTHDPSLRG
jgi:hypothetical protein